MSAQMMKKHICTELVELVALALLVWQSHLLIGKTSIAGK
jgi:hypothetical protein